MSTKTLTLKKKTTSAAAAPSTHSRRDSASNGPSSSANSARAQRPARSGPPAAGARSAASAAQRRAPGRAAGSPSAPAAHPAKARHPGQLPKTPNQPRPTEGERLSKRVAQLLGCSRTEAECYIENAAVQVDGQTVEVVGQRVLAHQQVQVLSNARPQPVAPVTLLLHKPADWAFEQAGRHGRGVQGNAWQLLTPERWSQGDAPAPIKLLHKHFQAQQPLLVLPVAASGLCVLSQDGRVVRKLTDDALFIEQEVIAHVRGREQMDPDGLQRLCDGTSIAGKRLPRIKVSWQNEEHLRFALQGIFAHEVQAMCHGVGLELIGLKRLRIGRIPLGGLPEGHWRYLQPWERF